MNRTHHEKRFFELFEGVFTGANIHGRPDSGYINLLRMKRKHFNAFRPQFLMGIDDELKKAGASEENTALRNELFDKLHTFFSRYFSESGSVFFRHTPAWQPVYYKVDDPARDVLMMWKTAMLHYVKTDTLACSMMVELDGELTGRGLLGVGRFFFDASELKPRENNEKSDFAFSFAGETKDDRGNKAVVIRVARPQKKKNGGENGESENGGEDNGESNGGKKQIADIFKKAKTILPSIDEDHIREAIAVFRRQTEADFFINRDAAGFLREQLDLWMFQYTLGDDSEFTAGRMAQLRALRAISQKVIQFVAEFENELVRIWEKPKFARAVNYVVTIDRLPARILQQAMKAKGAQAQVGEWAALGLIDGGASMKDVLNGGSRGKKTDPRFLPLDTKHFKELENDILAVLAEKHGGVDAALDGELIRSENWQALNNLTKKYRGRVKCIYIDPPFNLGENGQFDYHTNYKDSSWATMLQGRLILSREFLPDDGCIFCRVGHDGNHIVRFLLNDVYGESNYRNEIVVRRAEAQKGELMKQFASMRAMMVNYDNIYWFSKNEKARFAFITKPADEKQSQAQWHSFWKAEDRKELRYKIFDVDLSSHDDGQWMWSRERAFRAVDNYKEFLAVKDDFGGDLEAYWRANAKDYEQETDYKMEFIRRKSGGSGISSVEYWIPPRNYVISDNNWMDVKGYSNTTPFDTENSEALLERIIRHIPSSGDLVLDFFAGSGTTQAVAHKLGRKWLGVEMGEHFDTVILPRMKKVIAGHRSGINSKNGNGKNGDGCDYAGGGAFKYYALEQYEEALANARYVNDKPSFSESPYIFCKDEKMAWPLKIKDGKLSLSLCDLYDDIDLAETLSHLRGLPVTARTDKTVTLSDGHASEEYRIDTETMPEKDKQKLLGILKPCLWWE